jgi:phosphonate degradation associated HDIG domain protein
MTPTIESLPELGHWFATAGTQLYGGEAISQLEHALQSAHFAQLAGASPSLITAALLHDLGHLLANQQDHDVEQGIDDHHEAIAVTALKHLFGPAVLMPIALHVEAKRFLCATEADYLASLSPASLQSLQLQGGVMNESEVARFAARPYAADAVQLRRFDDQAKVVGLPTASLADYLSIATAVSHTAQSPL